MVNLNLPGTALQRRQSLAFHRKMHDITKAAPVTLSGVCGENNFKQNGGQTI